MNSETLIALIPIIPPMIEAGKSVWGNIVKPLLKGKGYNVTKEQDQEMIALEEKKDVKTLIEKLQNIDKELNQMAITQTYSGENGIQVGINNGVILHASGENEQSDVKKKLEILDEKNTINIEPLLQKKKHDKFCLIDVLFEMPSLADFSMSEIFKEYKNNRICKNNIIKPYVFNDIFMRAHTPMIVYESSDYVYNFSNWSMYDKLQIQNNYLKYSFSEMSDFTTLLINGSLLLGSIYSLLIIINRVLKTLNKDCVLTLKLSIRANEKMMFRMQKELMNIDDILTETYYLKKEQRHEIIFTFSSIDNIEINKFTNRLLGLFTSANPKSRIPFLSATIDETRKFYEILLTYDKYLMTGN
jgi:hypothetical protein